MNALLETERPETWKSSGEGRNERTSEQPFVERPRILIKECGLWRQIAGKVLAPPLN